jgi:transcriptional regulator EpsA
MNTGITMSNAPTPPPTPAPAAAPWADRRNGPDGLLTTRQAEQVLNLIEASLGVARRHQFFRWVQLHLHGLLPHSFMVCGSWQRHQRALRLDLFHQVVLPPATLQALGDPESAFMCSVCAAWIEGRGRPLLLDLRHFMGAGAQVAAGLQEALGSATELLVHGVTRPQRPHEIESLFVCALPVGAVPPLVSVQLLELCLPYLHSVWQRVLATEAGLGSTSLGVPLRPTPLPRSPDGGSITPREQQILAWVRDGKTNAQIGELLGISAYTVKNHLFKIARKLGASNRAQAAALAVQLGLLDPVRR